MKNYNFVQISQIVDGTELNTSHDFHDFKDFNKLPNKKIYHCFIVKMNKFRLRKTCKYFNTIF